MIHGKLLAAGFNKIFKMVRSGQKCSKYLKTIFGNMGIMRELTSQSWIQDGRSIVLFSECRGLVSGMRVKSHYSSL